MKSKLVKTVAILGVLAGSFPAFAAKRQLPVEHPANISGPQLGLSNPNFDRLTAKKSLLGNPLSEKVALVGSVLIHGSDAAGAAVPFKLAATVGDRTHYFKGTAEQMNGNKKGSYLIDLATMSRVTTKGRSMKKSPGLKVSRSAIAEDANMTITVEGAGRIFDISGKLGGLQAR